MKKIVLLLLVVNIFIGCKSTQLFSGKYTGKYGYYLTINADSTFEYEYMNGWGYERVLVSGKWISEGKQLLLNSLDTLMQNPLPLNVKERINKGNDSLKFILYIPQIDEYTDWTLVLNEVLYPLINDSIVCVKDTSVIKRFHLNAKRNMLLVPRINRETVQTLTYTLQNKQSNLVELSIPLTGKEIYRYASYELLNDTLIIKKDKLIWPRKNVILKYQKE